MHQFSVGMRRFFEAGHCGAAHVVDVFNMTNILVRNAHFALACLHLCGTGFVLL